MTSRTDPAGVYKRMGVLIESGQPFALATVLETRNSTPLKAGAKAVFELDGTIHGTVGGGAVEAEAQRLAGVVLKTGKPTTFHFNLHGPGVGEPKPICGGWMRLVIAPGSAASRQDYRRAAEALQQRQRGAWITVLRDTDKARVSVKSEFVLASDLKRKTNKASHGAGGAVSVDEVQSCLKAPECKLFTKTSGAGKMEVFVEPVLPASLLLLIGGGHVSQAVAMQAHLAGFDVAVVEDRPEFANPALFPTGARTYCGSLPKQIENLEFDADTYVVIVTRGHQLDATALRACIQRPCAYIGMIGSRRKVPLIRREFLRSGWATTEEFGRVYAPIGLDIGAVTVPEIAASIVAQLISVRRKGYAPRMASP